MKQYTARHLMRSGFREAFHAIVAGEDVYIVPGGGKAKDGSQPICNRTISAYGEHIAGMRFKIVMDEEVK